jgi:hypothetical protein
MRTHSVSQSLLRSPPLACATAFMDSVQSSSKAIPSLLLALVSLNLRAKNVRFQAGWSVDSLYSTATLFT